MVNINKLKAKMVEREMNVESTAERIGIDKATLYRRLKNPNEITIREADALAEVLEMTFEEATTIFFSQIVA